MYEQFNAQLIDSKEQLTRQAQLKASLAPARERLTAEAHRVHGIENLLAEVDDQIRSLESFTLRGVIDSLLWRKEGKLNHLREELARLAPEVETGERVLLELGAAVRNIETEITSIGNPEEIFKTVCDRKSEKLLADGGESAEQLQNIVSQLGAAKQERQSLRKSMHIGKNLVERLRSMSKASGRAKKKMIHGAGIGALASATINTIHQKGAEGSVDRARDGFQEFSRSIEALGVITGSERDAELLRIGTLLVHANTDLGSGGSLNPILDLICQATGLLQGKLYETESVVASLEARRIELIENA